MAKQILLKPVITEKANDLAEGLNQYTFIVDRKANKLEVKEAVEKMYNVTVVAVNTLNMPGKRRTRNTRQGVLKGMLPSYKKAVVTLMEGEEIDFYQNL